MRGISGAPVSGYPPASALSLPSPCPLPALSLSASRGERLGGGVKPRPRAQRERERLERADWASPDQKRFSHGPWETACQTIRLRRPSPCPLPLRFAGGEALFRVCS